MNLLLTGGTGSLGQKIVEKIIDKQTLERICIYSRDEHKQELMREKFKNNQKLRFFIGDIRDKERLTLACYNIQLIVHCAALKVVPTAEYNPFEALKTNTIGAQNLIEAAIKNVHSSYPKVLAISTDKAVHPINLYGATKLCAEKLFIAANNIMGQYGPRFSIARYGNVANSNGSVIPLFRRQLACNEQLTLTDDRMTRFWITLDEAVEFVLYCLNVMYGGETFVPSMSTFRVKDLALTMMENYPEEQRFCRVIGIRPGEKLHEEIITAEESQNSRFEPERKIYIINPPKIEFVDPNLVEKYWSNGLTSDNQDNMLSPQELKQKLVELSI